MLPVFVRTKLRQGADSSDVSDDPLLPTDLVPDGDGAGVRVDAMTLVAREKRGPYVPLLVALRSDVALRSAFARALGVASLKRARPLRTWMLAGLVPLLVVCELERELWSKGAAVGPRLFADAFLFVALAVELLRPVPARPRVVAAVFFAIGARYVYMILAAHGHGLSPVIWVAPAISIGAGALSFALPTRDALVDEIAERLRIEVPISRPEADDRLSGRAVMAAVGLPLALYVARLAGLSLWSQAGVFLVVGAIASYVVGDVRSAFGRGLRVTAESTAYGLVRTLGFAGLVHYVAEAGGEIWKMVSPASFSRTAGWFFEAEAAESSRQVEAVKSRLAFVAMTALFGPIIEELVYRSGLQRALVPRFGPRAALVLSSVVFAGAHFGVYRAAMVQTVILGIAFGLAWAEGGILVAILVHAIWNFYLLF